jgi:hypothetical protein
MSGGLEDPDDFFGSMCIRTTTRHVALTQHLFPGCMYVCMCGMCMYAFFTYISAVSAWTLTTLGVTWDLDKTRKASNVSML